MSDTMTAESFNDEMEVSLIEATTKITYRRLKDAIFAAKQHNITTKDDDSKRPHRQLYYKNIVVGNIHESQDVFTIRMDPERVVGLKNYYRLNNEEVMISDVNYIFCYNLLFLRVNDTLDAPLWNVRQGNLECVNIELNENKYGIRSKVDMYFSSFEGLYNACVELNKFEAKHAIPTLSSQNIEMVLSGLIKSSRGSEFLTHLQENENTKYGTKCGAITRELQNYRDALLQEEKE